MAKKNYYAVKNGYQTGIFQTWEECKKQVSGYPGAEYKGFALLKDAREYLGLNDMETSVAFRAPAVEPTPAAFRTPAVEPTPAAFRTPAVEPTPAAFRAPAVEPTSAVFRTPAGVEHPAETSPQDVQIYVDGSYAGGDAFSYGMVVLQGEEELCFSAKLEDEELARMHNVAGEIEGAKAAMQYAADHGFRRVIIYHDYEGIAKWCTREWKANKPATQEYRDFYDHMKERVRIEFQKVEGHSNNKYNDLADALAKKALGVGSEEKTQ